MSNTKLVTGLVRFSYVKVFTPEAVEEGSKKKYSISLLIPKTDKASIAAIEKAVAAATEVGKSSKFNGKVPANLKTPLRDGDLEKEDNEEYEGCYFLSASSLRKPAIIDLNGQEIIDPEEFYSGCYGKASLNFYPFNVGVNKGIAAGLNNLLKVKDGDSLAGSGTTAAEDFASELSAGNDDDLL